LVSLEKKTVDSRNSGPRQDTKYHFLYAVTTLVDKEMYSHPSEERGERERERLKKNIKIVVIEGIAGCDVLRLMYSG
jgi:hypothetical protein